MDNLMLFSKEFIETGKIPVDELLSRSVFYPACGLDGRPIKRFNPLYSQYRINSYMYVDYAIGNDLLTEHQDDFSHYHVFATRTLKRTDIFSGRMDFSKYESLLTPDEKGEYQEALAIYADDIKVFGKWIVYERDSDVDEKVGAGRFSILYLGGEGAATYAALYLSRNIAPFVLAIINPGISFGRNYSCFRSILSKIVESGKVMPKYYFSGNGIISASDCLLQKYIKGIIIC